MNIDTIKSNWEYATESLISGVLTIFYISGGIFAILSGGWLTSSENEAIIPPSLIITMGIMRLLLGFILIAISIGIYKKNKISVIMFSILMLIITFFAGFNAILLTITFVSIILTIKILYKNKSIKI